MALWTERYYFPPPESERPELERTPVAGAKCPECGSEDVRRYPIANQFGARMATKCQACMHCLSVERPGPDDVWPAFRSVTYDWPASPAERTSRDRLQAAD